VAIFAINLGVTGSTICPIIMDDITATMFITLLGLTMLTTVMGVTDVTIYTTILGVTGATIV
jgi:hypothetical protein